MRKPKNMSLYWEDRSIASITTVIMNRNTVGGVPIGDTYELQGSVFNKRGLLNVFHASQSVTFISGKITILGTLDNLSFSKDKRYKTNRKFKAELRPSYDSRLPKIYRKPTINRPPTYLHIG